MSEASLCEQRAEQGIACLGMEAEGQQEGETLVDLSTFRMCSSKLKLQCHRIPEASLSQVDCGPDT